MPLASPVTVIVVAAEASWGTVVQETPPSVLDCTSQSVIGRPPSLAGARHASVARPSPRVAASPDGAPGRGPGVTAADGGDQGPTPSASIVAMRKRWAVPAARTAIVVAKGNAGASGCDVQVTPSSVLDSTRWPVTGRPGTAGGADQDSVAAPAPAAATRSVADPRAVTVNVTLAERPRSSVAVTVTGSRPRVAVAASDQIQVPSPADATVPSEAESVAGWPASGAVQVPAAVIVPPIAPCTAAALAWIDGARASASSSATNTYSGRTYASA